MPVTAARSVLKQKMVPSYLLTWMSVRIAPDFISLSLFDRFASLILIPNVATCEAKLVRRSEVKIAKVVLIGPSGLQKRMQGS